jgi:hypothetical protein
MDPQICIQFLNLQQVNIHDFNFTHWFNKAYRTVARTIPGGLNPVQQMNICEYLRDELHNNIDVNTQEDFDVWHLNVINEISRLGNLQLGQSQKITNIMLKYYCCWYYSGQDPEFNDEHDHLALCFQYLHAPVDSIVLRRVFDLDEYDLDIIVIINPNYAKLLVNHLPVPWSSLDDYGIYMQLQNFIQGRADELELFSKLDFEMQHLWIV